MSLSEYQKIKGVAKRGSEFLSASLMWEHSNSPEKKSETAPT
jgi:hypothetical protein